MRQTPVANPASCAAERLRRDGKAVHDPGEGPNSAVIDVGRALRVPSQAALRARSGGCAWPGCDRPVAFTDAHHLVHWGHVGGTDMDSPVHRAYSPIERRPSSRESRSDCEYSIRMAAGSRCA
ncbi:MAG TPA: HNH endonuclease signature motif containing protein [Candidatus Saccharimonadales bacterium]|nr:HNH endonuclease signature motif containing protein [Candidatus Saccharimonadales bacterium]